MCGRGSVGWTIQAIACLTAAGLAAGGAARAADAQGALRTAIRTESFDHDPCWDCLNNRITPSRVPLVVQAFGYSGTNVAGKSPGELGGIITRAAEPAFYADRIGHKTLNDELTASGTFALNKTSGGAGIFFGFFHGEQPGGSGRPIGSLGLDFDFEQSGGRLAVRLITAKNQSCGTFITPFIPGKYRPTSLHSGTRYTWQLHYDPQAAGGKGQITFTMHDDGRKPQEPQATDLSAEVQQEIRRRYPETTTFTIDLPAGYKEQGTTFDHFGLINMMKPGGSAAIFFDDLEYVGHSQDFSHDPHWDSLRNHSTYRSTDAGGAHNFGYSETNFAGGERGEIGGTMWRGGKYAYYADRVGPLSLADRLEARGRFVLMVGAPDSDMYFGWFSSVTKDAPPDEAGNFLGIHVGGPTRIGHYFQPVVTTAKGDRFRANDGPVVAQKKVCNWRLEYDPNGDGGKGVVVVALDQEKVRLPLKAGVQAQGASFDRFGLFTASAGGQLVRVYLDDLQYTAARAH